MNFTPAKQKRTKPGVFTLCISSYTCAAIAHLALKHARRHLHFFKFRKTAVASLCNDREKNTFYKTHKFIMDYNSRTESTG